MTEGAVQAYLQHAERVIGSQNGTEGVIKVHARGL